VNLRSQLAAYFALVGLLGGMIATVFLFFYLSSDSLYVVLGLRHHWNLAIFPFAGALLSALYTIPFAPQKIGPALGAVIAILAFVTFCALVATVGDAGMWGFLAFAFFGFVFFGWSLVVLGALAGWYFKRGVKRAL
jgi:hypothetical protein